MVQKSGAQPSRYAGYRSFDFLAPGEDYHEFTLAKEIGRVASRGPELSDTQQSRVARLIAENTVISLHDHTSVFPEDITETFDYNRTGRQHTGYEGLSRSGIDAVFENFMDGTCCITSQMGWKWEDVLVDLGMRYCDIAKQDFVIRAEGVRDITDARANGQLALVPALEAATPIQNEVDRLDVLYGFGVRQSGIAYSESNTLGTGLRERHDGGLTYFGEKAVARMNKLGIAIDVSHSGDRTSMDTITTSKTPIFITHAGARSVWPTRRMKPDEVITACAQRGGVIGIEAAPHTTMSSNHPAHNLDAFMEHFTYCVEMVGIDHVAFGPDTLFGDHVGLHDVFAKHLSISAAHDGPRFDKVEYVDGIENPAEEFHHITGWLVAHDYSDDEIGKVLGGNILRVLDQVW